MINAEEKYSVKFIDCSSFCSFKRCPAKYFFSRVLGLESPDRNRRALDYGTSIHSALPKCFTQGLKAAKDEFDSAWEDYGYDELGDDKRNKARAHLSIEEFYNCRCSPSAVKCYKPLYYPISAPVTSHIDEGEIPFLIDVGADLPFMGRVDMPVKWNSTGDVWALDFKTSYEVSARFFDGFSISPQAIGYTLALGQIQGYRAQGMIIEAIRSSKIRAESQMHMVTVSDHMIEQFKEQLTIACKMIESMNDSKQWLQNFAGCNPYASFGMPGYNCEFQTLCKLPDWRDGVKFFNRSRPFQPFEMNWEDKETENA